LLLLLLVVFHDLETLLLDQASLLNVELLLGLGIDLLGFLIGLLLNERHHVLDLKQSSCLVVACVSHDNWT